MFLVGLPHWGVKHTCPFNITRHVPIRDKVEVSRGDESTAIAEVNSGVGVGRKKVERKFRKDDIFSVSS